MFTLTRDLTKQGHGFAPSTGRGARPPFLFWIVEHVLRWGLHATEPGGLQCDYSIMMKQSL
jgi:hypothetical protein